jgi:hypothetical protein
VGLIRRPCRAQGRRRLLGSRLKHTQARPERPEPGGVAQAPLRRSRLRISYSCTIA